MSEKTTAEKIGELLFLYNQDDDIKDMIKIVIRDEGVFNMGELASERPEQFDLLYEEVMSLIEQIPLAET